MTQSSSSGSSVASLLAGAQSDGLLSQKAMSAINIVDIGEQIQAGIGVDVSDVQASEVVLVTILIDDSGSIRYVAGNAAAVREGHNLVLDALDASKQQAGILTHTRYLNGHVLFPYVVLKQATRMDQQNYNPNGGTPLYDQAVVTFATVIAKAQSFEDNGVPCRTVTLIVTDGNDEGSRAQRADTVKAIVESMLKTENHIIAAMGISDGYTDFDKVFAEMGIPSEWRLTTGNNASEIRKAFNVFSQSAVRASQSGASFSQTAAGGFGAP